MATHTIPNSIGELKQNNFREDAGEISNSFNLDLVTKRSKILTSKKLKRVLSANDDFSASSTIADVLSWNGNYYALTEDNLYKSTSSPTSGYSVVSNSQGAISASMCVFDGQLRIVDDTDIRRYTGSGSVVDNWWTSTLSGTALGSTNPHITTVSSSQKETFWVTDGSVVRYFEKGAAATQNVQLDTFVTATTIDSALDGSVWVGSFNETTERALVYQIYANENVDGTPVYRQAYPIDGKAVLALWVRDNTPFIITEKGLIQSFNGVGFTTVAKFPFDFGDRHLDGVEPGLIQDSNRARPIHPRGVKYSRDVAFININTEETNDGFSVDSRAHSGVWTFDHLTQQLTHYLSLAEDTTEIGSHSMEHSGPILLTDSQDGQIFVCGGVNGDDGMFALDTEYTSGFFTTAQYTSQTVTEAYEAIYHKAKLHGDAKVYTFYRNTTRDTIRTSASWLTTDTFNTTDDISELAVGDMVIVSHGTGAGKWSIVKEISNSPTVTSVKLKDAIGVAGSAVKIYSDNYKLLGFDTTTLTYDETNTFTSADGELKKLGTDAVAGWAQFLVLMEGRVEYRQFIVKGSDKNMV